MPIKGINEENHEDDEEDCGWEDEEMKENQVGFHHDQHNRTNQKMILLPAGTIGAQATIQGKSSHLGGESIILSINVDGNHQNFSTTFFVGLLQEEEAMREVKEQPL